MRAGEAREGTLQHKLYTVRKMAERPSLSQEEFGERLGGLSRSLVSRYETDPDREVPLSYIKRIVSVYPQWPLEWFYDGRPGLPAFLTGLGIAPGINPPTPDQDAASTAQPGVGRRMYPLVGVAGAASFPIRSEEPFEGDFIEFSEDLFRPERFVIQAKGDSMHPRVEHGDYVLVQPDSNPSTGLIVVAESDEHEFAVKVLRAGKEGKELHPINQGYEVMIPSKGWRVVGYAVGRKQERGKGRYIEEGDNAGLRP